MDEGSSSFKFQPTKLVRPGMAWKKRSTSLRQRPALQHGPCLLRCARPLRPYAWPRHHSARRARTAANNRKPYIGHLVIVHREAPRAVVAVAVNHRRVGKVALSRKWAFRQRHPQRFEIRVTRFAPAFRVCERSYLLRIARRE